MSADLERSLDDIIQDKRRPSTNRDSGRIRKNTNKDRRRPNRRSENDVNKPGTLLVENLFHELDEDSLYDLFTKIGRVKKIRIDYDRAGRSNGTAHVTYEKFADAIEAVRSFDGRRAAGQKMYLSIQNDVVDLHDRIHLPGRPERRRQQRRSKPIQEKPKPKPKATAEDLDAELEAYMAS